MTAGARNVEDVYELSPMQQGLLYQLLASPGTGAYVEQLTAVLRGELDLAAFRQAWAAVIQRHPILRTSLHWEQVDHPVQVVHRAVELPLEELDWTGSDPAAHPRRFEELLAKDRLRGFALDRAPLIRLTLVRCGPAEHRFAWTFPHLVMDGWSFGLALQEFLVLYRAHFAGRPDPLSPARPYRDYIAWRQRRETGADEGFWRTHLAGYAPPEPLTLGEPGPLAAGEPTHAFEELLLHGFARRLEETSRQRALTLATIIHGCWTLLMGAYTGRADLVTAATSAQRPTDLPGASTILGPMIVTLPVRARLVPDQAVGDWLHAFQAALAEIRERGTAPLVDIQRWSGVGPRQLFESSVVFENVPVPEITLAEEGLEIVEPRYDGRPHYPLSLVVFPGDDLSLRLIYDRRRADRPAIRRLLDQLQVVLEAVVADPGRRLDAVPLLPAGEQDLLRDWGTGAPAEETEPLPRAFARQAARTPDAVALSAGPEQVTYRDLDDRSRRLAARLAERGVGPGDLVALHLRRSPEMLVAVLGVLRAGAAYLPLDPAVLPAQRLQSVLAEAAPALLVTDGEPADTGPPATRLADLDRAGPADPDGVVAAEPEVGPGDLAYVIYTSGSTGRPKGVAVRHGALMNYLSWAVRTYRMAEADGAPLHSSFGVDLTVTSMLGPLLAGRTVTLLPDGADVAELAAVLTGGPRFSLVKGTPSTFEALRHLVPAGPLRTNVLVLGGEGLPDELAAEWNARDPLLTVVNEYGPTEAAVGCGAAEVPRAADPAGTVSLGGPIPGVRYLVLDAWGRPVPVGVTGELHIGGACLARGYWRRPDLTADRFVPGVFAGDPDGRAYRSGDLVRYRPDGRLDWLGRIDDQVKIRGHRVELGDVEAVLRGHPDVRAAAAAVRPDPAGVARLVGYLVSETAVPPAAELRAYLLARLPEHMVPTAFVPVDELPRTAGGKLDRAALAVPEPAPAPSPRRTAPRTPTEVRLADLVAGLLGAPDIGVTDDLAAAGLHSLLATRLVARVRHNLGRDLPLRTVLATPTVAALAATLDGVAAPEPDDGADLRADARLDPAVRPIGPPRDPAPPRRVLLTGATGFLGSHLLARLLRDTGADVLCLVRAQDAVEGRRRLLAALADVVRWRPGDSDRIVPVLGDLGRPRLGLTAEAFDRLAADLDLIVHCGAVVNFALPYGRLRDANVRGTEDVLRLATRAGAVPLHHVSTVGVAAIAGVPGQVVTEDDELPDPPDPATGYARSKWVAEQLVLQARDRGLPVTVYRPGRVTPELATGRWNPTDTFGMLLRTSIELGVVPDFELELDMTPVDWVASALVTLATDPAATGRVLHLVNPRRVPVRRLVDRLRAGGQEVRVVPVPEWFAAIRDRSRRDESAAVLVALLGPWVDLLADGRWEPRYDTAVVTGLLAPDQQCPDVGDTAIDRYLAGLGAPARAEAGRTSRTDRMGAGR